MSLGVTLKKGDERAVFSANITHDLITMAVKAGIYQACWHPEEIGAVKAGQLIEYLEKGLVELEAEQK